ncbi:Acetylornithine deacetylase (plasmid) [Paracoccaceae bacterium]|nr:Acetylornithine deacetylase [Paracoccaceae bacterium]
MTARPDVVDLARKLIALDTVNPPGNERAALDLCAGILTQAGFDCRLTPVDGAPLRANLVATRGTGTGPALGFSAHLDTVPFGAAPWRHPPLSGHVEDGRLYGRGSSDMKAAVAAVLVACCDPHTPPGGIAVILTCGEETGCDGARLLVQAAGLPHIGALVVPESTGNAIVHGHKGVLWLKLAFHGVTAHGAMPEAGRNAIGLAVDALTRIRDMPLGPTHPVMGHPTLNIGTIHGGINTNSVPDLCEVTLDLRTLPGTDHADLTRRVADLAGPDATVSPLIDLPSIWTDPDDPWVRATAAMLKDRTGRAAPPASVNYFTDAALLTPALGNPATIIFGPGDPGQPHATNEWVHIDALHDAVPLMRALIRQGLPA